MFFFNLVNKQCVTFKDFNRIKIKNIVKAFINCCILKFIFLLPTIKCYGCILKNKKSLNWKLYLNSLKTLTTNPL